MSGTTQLDTEDPAALDLSLYRRVIWRFRLIVALGFVVACVLSALTYGRPGIEGGFPRLDPREAEIWRSSAILHITQGGFPIGRSAAGLYTVRTDPTTGRRYAVTQFAEDERFSDLASLFAELAMSDNVWRLMVRDGPAEGFVEAVPVKAGSRDTLPILRTAAYASSPEAAVRLADRHVAAFLEYLEREQRAAAIPRDARVLVSVLQRPAGAGLVEGRKLTQPIAVFVASMFLVLGLTFVLENLRRRGQPSASAISTEALEPARARRSV